MSRNFEPLEELQTPEYILSSREIILPLKKSSTPKIHELWIPGTLGIGLAVLNFSDWSEVQFYVVVQCFFHMQADFCLIKVRFKPFSSLKKDSWMISRRTASDGCLQGQVQNCQDSRANFQEAEKYFPKQKQTINTLPMFLFLSPL